MTQEILTLFFGWTVVINIALLTVFALFVIILRNWASGFHARLFGLDAADVRLSYFYFIAGYEVLAFVLSFVPWLALTLM